MPARRLLTVAGLIAVLASSSACAAGGSGPGPGSVSPSPATVTVTVPPSTSASVPTGVTASAARPTGHQSVLGGTCDSLLDQVQVEQAAGVSIKGSTSFVVGVAEPDIGRLSYLNCRYGLAPAGGTPGLEIGVSLYRTAAQAAARIRATVEDYDAHGAAEAPTSVGGVRGTTLTGGTGADYAVPTLVLSSGQRTVAVSATAELAPAARRDKILAAVAGLVLERTGG